MLACRDFDSTELALASHLKFLPSNTDFYFLQNCRGGYDAERTYAAGKRYQRLYPERFHMVDDIPPAAPYHSLRKLIDRLSGYDLICKTDDDAFPLSSGWLDSLIAAYEKYKRSHGDQLAYVTPLVNNNTWGFIEVLKAMNLEAEYFSELSRPHLAGFGSNRKVYPADQIIAGQDGTIWGNAYIAKWIHANTTFLPDKYLKATQGLSETFIPEKDRFSINCILFEPNFWEAVDTGGSDDEGMIHKYCANHNKRIVCVRSVPFVHLSYFSQREELRETITQAKEIYADHLKLPFPIGIHSDRSAELEARLRWIENATCNCNNGNPHNLGGNELARLLLNKLKQKILR